MSIHLYQSEEEEEEEEGGEGGVCMDRRSVNVTFGGGHVRCLR